MKLFGSYTSPYVRHCRIALAESGLMFEFVETDQAGSAAQSPTQRVPFLQDGDLFLTDSSSILKYVREKSGQKFFEDVKDYDLFCLANTLMDTLVNLFFLQRDGVDVSAYAYMQRQANRISSALEELNEKTFPKALPLSDAHLRLACILYWADFRKRIQLDQHENLKNLVALANTYDVFAKTAPPQS